LRCDESLSYKLEKQFLFEILWPEQKENTIEKEFRRSKESAPAQHTATTYAAARTLQ
jgi:hypothetical protein